MEKQETHAPHHDENQKTHAPATMPCACTGYGEPLPRLPINTGRKDKKREESRGKQAAETGKKRGGKRKEQGKTGKLQKRKKGETRGCKILEKERRAVTEREARREKGERNRKQRLDRREAKPEKERGNEAGTGGIFRFPAAAHLSPPWPSATTQQNHQ
jgi:hypothetical protein